MKVWKNWNEFRCNIPNINPFNMAATNLGLFLYPSKIIPLIKISSRIAGVMAVKKKFHKKTSWASSIIISTRVLPKNFTYNSTNKNIIGKVASHIRQIITRLMKFNLLGFSILSASLLFINKYMELGSKKATY